MYYVYVLKSAKTGKFYKGSTADLKSRLAKHNAGGVSSTKAFALWELIYY